MIPIHKYRKIQLIKSPNYGILILTIKGNNIYSGILTSYNVHNPSYGKGPQYTSRRSYHLALWKRMQQS